MPHKLTTEEFIKRAKIIHHNKYDYSKVNFKNIRTKICIICPVHGEFYQTPKIHLNGHGCPKCSNNRAKTTEEFINEAKHKYGEKYDYSKVKYINNTTPICIIDKTYGEYYETPKKHLSNNGGFPKHVLKRINHEKDIISKSIKLNGNIYDFSKMIYNGMDKKVIIIDKEKGEFTITPKLLLKGYGFDNSCTNRNLSKIDFIKKMKHKYGNEYDLTNIVYIDYNTPINLY